MRRTTRNYILALIMALLALLQAVSGFILWLLPRGYMGGRGATASGGTFIWPRDTWIDIHDWTAAALVVIVVVHIILHWGWIVGMTRSYFSQK